MADDLEATWSQLLSAISRASRFAHTYLVQAHPVAFHKNVLTIGFDPEFEDQMGLADNSKTHDLLQTKLAELGHPGTMVKFVIADAPDHRITASPITETTPEQAPEAPRAASASKRSASQTSAKPSTADVNKDEFRNDPLIRKALEIFKGQIVDVRG